MTTKKNPLTATERALKLQNGYIDTTKTGPLSYKQLQQLNSNLPKAGREYMENDYGAGIIQSMSQPTGFHLDPVNDDYDIGESMFDKGIYNPAELENYQDIRAENQPLLAKAAAGILKGGILAGTTFVDGTLGLGVGIVAAICQGDFSKIWDNEVTQGLDMFNKEMENVLPNYYTKEEQEKPWYTQLLTTNFIFDKFVKNMGFTIGAAYTGGVYSSLLNLGIKGLAGIGAVGRGLIGTTKAIETGLGTIERIQKYAPLFERALNMKNGVRASKALFGATMGAIAEGTVEAVSNSNDMINLQTMELEDKATQDKQVYLEELKDNIYNGMPEEEAYAIFEEKVNKVDKALEDAKAVQEEHRKKMGTADLLLNIPILTLDNFWQFGKMWSGGYKAARNNAKTVTKLTKEAKREAKEAWKSSNKQVKEEYKAILKKAKKEGYGALTESEKALIEEAPKHLLGNKSATVYAALKAPAREANEEMAQGFASEATGQYHKAEGDYIYESQIHPESSEELRQYVGDFWGATFRGFSETYLNPNRWEEGFIGALTGALGSPTFGKSNNNTDQTLLGRGKMIGLSGGAIVEARDFLKKRREQDKAAQEITRILKDPKTIDRWKHVTAQIKFDKDKKKGAYLGDKKMFKDAETAALFEDIMYAKKTNNLDKLKRLIGTTMNASDEEINEIASSVEKLVSINDNNVNEHATKLNALIEQRDSIEAAYQQAIDQWKEAADNNASPKIVETLYNRIEEYKKQLADVDNEISIINNRLDNAIINKSSPYIHEDGTPFTKEEIKEKLNERGDNALKLIDEISEIQDKLDQETSEVLSDEQIATMTYYEVAKRDWARRGADIINSFREQIADENIFQYIVDAMQKHIEGIESLGIKISKKKRKELEESKKSLESLQRWGHKLLENPEKILPYLIHNAKIKSKNKKGEEVSLDYAEMLYDILTNAVELDPILTDSEKENKKKDIEDLKKIVEAYKKYDEDLVEFMKEPSKVDKQHTSLFNKNTVNKLKNLFKGIKDKIDFKNPDSIRKTLKEAKDSISEAGGMKKFLDSLSKEEREAVNKALNEDDASKLLKETISKNSEDSLLEKAAQRVINDSDIELTSKGFQEWAENPDKLDTHISKIAQQITEEQGIDDVLAKQAYQDSLEEKLKALLDKSLRQAASEVDKVETERQQELDTLKKASEDKKQEDEPSPRQLREGARIAAANEEGTIIINYDENYASSESEVKKARRENKEAGLKQLESLEGFERRRQFTELYIYGVDGITLYDYYSQNLDKIPKGVDKNKFLDYIKRVDEFLKKEGAYTRISGINDNDKLKENDKLIFEVEPSLSKEGVDVVVIKTEDGRVVGTIRSQFEFDIYDQQIKDGKPKNTAIEAQRELYNAVIENSKKENAEPITTTVESLNRGSLPLSSEDSLVSEIFEDAVPIIGVVTGTIGSPILNIGDRNIKTAIPLNLKPGQIYVLIPSNDGTYIPAMCYSTPINDLPKDDWYIQQTINAFMEMIQSSSSIIENLNSFMKWLPVKNLHVDLQIINKNYNKEDKNSHPRINVDTIEEADFVTISFIDKEGKKKTFPFKLYNENGKRKTEEEIRTTIAEKFIYSTAKANQLQVNIDKRRLKDKEYIKQISKYYSTNLMRGIRGQHSMNDGFLYKPTSIETQYEEKGKRYSAPPKTGQLETLGTVKKVMFNGDEYTIDATGVIRDSENKIVSEDIKNKVLDSLKPKSKEQTKQESTKNNKSTIDLKNTDKALPNKDRTEQEVLDFIESLKPEDKIRMPNLFNNVLIVQKFDSDKGILYTTDGIKIKKDNFNEVVSEEDYQEFYKNKNKSKQDEGKKPENEESKPKPKISLKGAFGKGSKGGTRRTKPIGSKKEEVQEDTKGNDTKATNINADDLVDNIVTKLVQDKFITSLYRLNSNGEVSIGDLVHSLIYSCISDPSFSLNSPSVKLLMLYTDIKGDKNNLINVVQNTVVSMMLDNDQIRAIKEKLKPTSDSIFNKAIDKATKDLAFDNQPSEIQAKILSKGTKEDYESLSLEDKLNITKCS